MINRLFLFILFFSGVNIYAQQINCKVIKADISGSYSGGCKNGLAQGKGIAEGVDRYEGQFYKGMPEGKGTYKWANGTYYEGQWKNGLREGRGKMVYGDSVVIGYWKDDKYVGEKFIPPFKITSSLNVIRYTIMKTGDLPKGVRMRFTLGGVDNVEIEDFSLAYDSGDEYRMGNTIGIQNTSFPLDVKVKYKTRNLLHTVQYNVIFEFTINEPGAWNATITN